MNVGSDVAKAGWLFRQSSVLHRWKRNWFVLYRDGLLRYFETQQSSRAEEVFILRNVCKGIKTGSEVRSASVPEGSGGKSCMFGLEMRDGNDLFLCAETEDDMRAWQYALDEARLMQAPGPSPANPSAVPIGYTYQRVPFGGYPGQVISTHPQPQVIHATQGTTTIIAQPPQQMVYVDDDYRYGGYRGFGHHRRYRHHPGTVYVATPRYW